TRLFGSRSAERAYSVWGRQGRTEWHTAYRTPCGRVSFDSRMSVGRAILRSMTNNEHKAVLHRYLSSARENLRWKLAGLSEYDARRPLTPTGTNLLGLLKHSATAAYGYFGETFARPYEDGLPWMANGGTDNG